MPKPIENAFIESIIPTSMLETTLATLFNIEPRDVKLYISLLEPGPKRINEIASMTSQDYTTTYRSIQRAMLVGLVFREMRTYRRGGRYYVYEARDPKTVRERALKLLDEWERNARKEIETIGR